jgi:hypothetical protein
VAVSEPAIDAPGPSAPAQADPAAAPGTRPSELASAVFGVSGRTLEEIRAAVAEGYRTFDCADTYGETLTHVATAIRESGTPRRAFEVIYKIDATEPAELAAHVRGVAQQLGGYVDHVLIHKVTDAPLARRYEPILAELQRAGVVSFIGSGDVKAGMDPGALAARDSFEIDAADLLIGPTSDELAAQLAAAGKPVFVYNIIGTLKRILGTPDRPTPDQVRAVIAKLQNRVPTAEPILTSSRRDGMAENLKLELDDVEDWGAFGDAGTAIDAAAAPAAAAAAVPIEQMSPDVSERVFAILYSGPEWAAESLFDDPARYLEERDRHLAAFTPAELDVRYQRGSAEHSLRQAIEMLFDSQGNCHRVAAVSFLTG